MHREIRFLERAARGALLAGAILFASAAAPADEPHALSPGRADGAVASEVRCPTFSWSEAFGALGYELEIAPGARAREDAPPPRRIALPAGSLAWTASGGACLEPGARYSWRVRALHPSGPGAWQEAREIFVRPEETGLRSARRRLGRLARERLSGEELDDLAALGWQAPPTAPSGFAEPNLTPVRPERLRSISASVVTPPSSALVYLDAGDDVAVWAQGEGYGVWGETAADGGTGLYGVIDQGEAMVSTIAIEGVSQAVGGVAVLGEALTEHGALTAAGVEGRTLDGIGLHGLAASEAGAGVGVYGESGAEFGRGVMALGESGTSGSYYGAWGESASSSGYDFYAGGAGMDYGPFTGSHEVRLDAASATPRPGMVVSLTGRAEVRLNPDGSVDLSSTLPSVTLSGEDADPEVLGVFVRPFELPADHWLEDRSGRFAVVNALGEGRVWVTDRNGPVAAGDFLTTSAVPGYAQKQDEPELRSHTLGRATESVDWNSVTHTVTHDGQTYRAALVAVVYTSG